MATDYVRLTSGAMEDLPVNRQAEVYDFVEFLKSRSAVKTQVQPTEKRAASMLDLLGTGASHIGDVSVNHDR